jgi:hypothetical protein
MVPFARKTFKVYKSIVIRLIFQVSLAKVSCEETNPHTQLSQG